MAEDLDVVLGLIRRVIELATDAMDAVDGETARYVQSACLTQWTWLAHHYVRDLGGEPWKVEPLITRVGDDVTRWEHGPDGITTSDEP